ncbi:MAG: hypothetical protein GY807_24885 [Gammaproteobacteria bacterium]|nr:hypothetical protein [Gammaproteobacteria bacterium]
MKKAKQLDTIRDARSLAEDLGITQEEADAIIEACREAEEGEYQSE